MTEAEWLACADPRKMLKALCGRVTERKVRLFACACCQRTWELLVNRRSREALFSSERYAEGQDTKEQMRQHRRKAAEADRGKRKWDVKKWAAEAATFAASVDIYAYLPHILNRLRKAQGETCTTAENTVQAGLLHDLFGNPFRPVVLDPALLTSDVVALAQAAYEERELPRGTLDPARLAVLADALEEVGCRDQQILQHLRGPGPHVRGCWAIDLLLGKQ